VYDASRAVLTRINALIDDPSPLSDAAEAAAADVRETLADHGTPQFSLELDLRYVGQSYELSVPLSTPITGEHVTDAIQDFHDDHRDRYGHANPDEPVEAVALRVRGRVDTASLPLHREPETDRPLDTARLGPRPVWFVVNGPTSTMAYARTDLHHGHEFNGPAVLHQYDSTIVVPPRWHVRIDAGQNIWIER